MNFRLRIVKAVMLLCMILLVGYFWSMGFVVLTPDKISTTETGWWSDVTEWACGLHEHRYASIWPEPTYARRCGIEDG